MSPTPEPQPGTYLDSCHTRYLATRHPKTGWWLQKQAAPPGKEWPPAYQKPDFPAAVLAQIFIFQSDSI